MLGLKKNLGTKEKSQDLDLSWALPVIARNWKRRKKVIKKNIFFVTQKKNRKYDFCFFAGAQKNEIWATKNAQAWILVGLCLLLQETGKV